MKWSATSIRNFSALMMARRWVRVSLLSLVLLMLFVGLTLGAFTWVMAKVPAYRAQMQVWLSKRAKLDIKFDALRAEWRGYGPELVFTHAILRSQDRQRVVAVAEQGSVGFDLWQALLTGRLNAARFRLEGTELKLQRTAEGRFEFIGQADWPEFDAHTNFDFDALPVGEFAIRRVKFSFRDLKTGRGPWSLSGIEMDITRDTDQFLLQGRALLPDELGANLHFEAQGQGSLQSLNQLSWQASIDGSEIDLAGWEQVMPDDWPAPHAGQGSFHLNAKFTGGQVYAFCGNIKFQKLALHLPVWQLSLPHSDVLQKVATDQLPLSEVKANSETNDDTQFNAGASVLDYSKVAVSFESRSTAQGWSTQFSNLQLERDGAPWPAGKASLMVEPTKQPDGSRSFQKLNATAQSLVLENLWPLLAYLPETERHAYWRALRATGQIKDVQLSYEWPAHNESSDGDSSYSLKFQFDQLGFAPINKQAGVSGFSGQLTATNAGGSVNIDSNSAAINLPRLFRTPLPMDHFKGVLSWAQDEQGIALRSENLTLENTDGKLQASLKLDLPTQGVPIIDMRAFAQDLNVEATPRYLPAGIMHEHVLNWLDTAFRVGKVVNAEAILKGPLKKFPFRQQEGEFLVKAQLEGLTLQYQKGWTPATGLTATAEFHNAGFTAVATAGSINGLSVERIEGGIKDFRDSQLIIDGRVSGALNQGLSFVQRSPVGPAIGDLFQRLSGKGSLQAQVRMNLPLQHMDRHKVDVDVALNKATLTVAEVQPSVSELSGNLHIKNSEVTAASLRGRFMQGAFKMKSEPTADGHYTLVTDGQLQSQSLMELLHLPSWMKVSGAATYRLSMPGYAQVSSAGVRHLYSVISNLEGLQIDLPEPVGKAGNTQRSFALNVEMPEASVLQVRGSLGELRSLLRFKQVKNHWQFDRAGLRADGVAAALPAHSGLRVEGKLDRFSLDEWLQLGVVPNIKNSVASSVRVQDVLRAANVTVDHFYLYGFEWPALRAVLQATDGGWRIDVSGDHASGQLNVPYVLSGGNPLRINMERLWFQPRVVTSTNRSAVKTLNPQELPSIHSDIKELRVGDHDFGALQLAARRTAQGIEVDQVHIEGETFNGNGHGRWIETASGQQGAIALTLDSNDVRATLSQLKYGEAISGKRGKLLADLYWSGGLDAQLLGRVSGTIEVQVDEGQLLNVEPGAGRVLGLLSITTLPRRLGLDFRDLTNKGLAFDTIHADFAVNEGNAKTQNLILRGPTADIGIAGRIGLGARDYDQTAAVASNVSSAIPVAAVAVGAPVVGAAIALFSQIFKEPLKGVSRAYYHIGGSWDDPKVERIDADVGKASMSGAEAVVAP